ncbi:MAG TPA: hypothetical protein VIC52_07455 [Actinomycetota bacterium]
MRRTFVFVVSILALAFAACSDPSPTQGGSPTQAPSPEAEVDEERLGVYSALITELSGAESGDWHRVYVVTGLCDDAAEPSSPKGCEDSLSEAEQEALRDRLGIDGLRFVDDPTPIYEQEGWLSGTPRTIVVRLGPIAEREDEVRVGASYGCGGLCGSGTTYVLERRGGEWKVVGQRGPMWIA